MTTSNMQDRFASQRSRSSRAGSSFRDSQETQDHSVCKSYPWQHDTANSDASRNDTANEMILHILHFFERRSYAVF